MPISRPPHAFVTFPPPVRSLLSRPSRRRALVLPLALALALFLAPTHAVGAVGDPVARAEGRVAAALEAAFDATARYDEVQTTYYELADEIARTRERLAQSQRDAAALRAVAKARALQAYKGEDFNLDVLMSGTNVMDAMRRNAMLEGLNEKGNDAIDGLEAMTEELHAQETALDERLAQQAKLVADLDAKRSEVLRLLDDGVRAEEQLLTRLDAEQRGGEFTARVARARAAGGDAASQSSGAPAGAGFQCPVPGSSFSDSFGAARSGGRGHQGVDMMAGRGTPILAVVSGIVSQSSSGLGGNQISLAGSDGNTYFYAHLQSYVGGPGPVNAGDVIGKVGDTGNARGTPHLHFEIHPGGGAAVNPYPTVRANC
jgi:peptidoglycan LD-endopeptidase LytH